MPDLSREQIFLRHLKSGGLEFRYQSLTNHIKNQSFKALFNLTYVSFGCPRR